ncbi:MAG: hypothetical protein PHC41_11050 [Lachnospiraceae bacterium]|nr:hypothetical protein [Lachnospiraceae bacterium]MDD3616744.1 hypothetical protein [Lachnospiraceae bacterium]
MKKGKLWILSLLSFAVVIGGCGLSNTDTKQEDKEMAEDTQEVEEDKQEAEEDKQEAAEDKQDAAEEAQDIEAGEIDAQNDYPREIASDEIASYTQWIQDRENYGFVLSEYSRPEDVDLNQVLYTGAGLESRGLTEQETAQYLEITGQDEIYTDCAVLSTSQINDYLERKMDISIDDLTQEFGWVYLNDTDVWATEHGDTNYVQYQCVGGIQKDEDTYVLDMEPVDFEENGYYKASQLTLEKEDNDYNIVSNIYK